MDQSGINSMEKDCLKMQVGLMRVQVKMTRSPVSQSIKE
jgi:hypothetical protein